MPPKKDKLEGEGGLIYEVSPSTSPGLIADVFKGFMRSASPTRFRPAASSPVMADDDENLTIGDEYTHLCALNRLELEHNAHIAAERTKRRVERRNINRRQEEERILKEKQNNPLNLFNCAQLIQKGMRGRWVRKEIAKVMSSLTERSKKRALIIAVNDYEDPRVRAPAMLSEDAMHIARILRAWGWHVDVLCNSIKTEATKPTRANITEALAKAAQVDKDTFMWVHVCGCGGTASVNGKNPHRQAQKEMMALQTPRTRLFNALATMNRRSGSVATGDICHFLLPYDGKTGRLTFDTINTFDEVLDILEGKHGEEIYGRPLNQRMVTIDIAPFGHIEGLQGGAGCATLASTATGHMFYDYANASPMDDFSPKRYGILSHCILEALRGQAWERPVEKPVPPPAAAATTMTEASSSPTAPSATDIAKKDDLSKKAGEQAAAGTTSPSSSTARPFPADKTPEKPTHVHLIATGLVKYIDRMMESLHVSISRRGHVWGEIPLLSGETMSELIPYFERIYAHTMTPLPKSMTNAAGVVGALSDLESPTTTEIPQRGRGLSMGRKKKKAPSLMRQCLGTATCRVDITQQRDRPDIFSADFQTVMAQYLAILSQPDPTIAPSRYYKVQFPNFGFHNSPVVCLGINGTFVDIASKAKTKGAEATLWTELEKSLQDERKLNVKITCGKQGDEGGGVLVRIETPDKATLNHVIHKLDMVPIVLNGYEVSIMYMEFAVNFWMSVAGIDRLNLFARNMLQVAPMPQHANKDGGLAMPGERHLEMSGLGSSESMANFGTSSQQQFSSPSFSMRQDDSDGEGEGSLYGITPLIDESVAAFRIRRAAMHSREALEHYLTASFSANTGITVNPKTIRFIGQGHPLAVRVLDAQPMVQRLTDLDDETLMESCLRRVKPQGSPVAIVHQGLALCVVAINGGTSEQKINQVRELYKAGKKYEVFYNMKFLIWDTSEAIKIDPKEAVGHPKLETSKLLEAVRISAQGRGLPALLIFDLVKKKTFRVRPIDTAPPVVPTASSPSPGPTEGNRGSVAGPEVPGRRRSLQPLNSAVLAGVGSPSRNASVMSPTNGGIMSPGGGATTPNPTSYSPTPSAAMVSQNMLYYTERTISLFVEEFAKGALNDLLPPVKGAKSYGRGVRNTKYSVLAM